MKEGWKKERQEKTERVRIKKETEKEEGKTE